MEFSDWITDKYIKWRGDRFGKGSSVAEFAKNIGAPQSLMSYWMKKGGKVPTSKKHIDALIAVYGDEARQILGITSEADPARYDSYPPDLRAAFLEIDAELARLNIGAESPLAETIVTTIMARYGWSHTSTTEHDSLP
jgi:hypothetical protein